MAKRYGVLAALWLAAAAPVGAVADDTSGSPANAPPANPGPSSATTSEDAKPAAGKPDVARGDRWVYEVRDDITDELKLVTDYAVTDVADNEITTRTRFTNLLNNNAETTVAQTFDSSWRTKDNGNFTFSPRLEDVGVPADLQVGKTWKYAYETVRVNPPVHFNYVGTAKVLAMEKVAVANGLSFDAYKVAYDSSVVPVVNNRKFETKVVLWYAPAANRYVKRTYESRVNGKLTDASVEILRDYRRRAR